MSDLKGIPISSLPNSSDVETTDRAIIYRDIDGKAYKTSVSNLMLGATKQALIDSIYPVGSIYMSMSSTNPENFLGGTWKQIEDTFLLAAGSSHAAETKGGAETVTLTTNNLPSHTHSTPSHTHSIPALSGTAASAGRHRHSYYYDDNASTGGSGTRLHSGGSATSTGAIDYGGAHTHDVTTTASTTGSSSGTSGSTGSGSAVSIMPPYLSVYMWQRTA